MIRTLITILVAFTAGVPGAWAQTAADAYYDPEEMAEARREVRQEHGGNILMFFEGERLEYQSNNGEPLFLWDAQGWIGGDRHKFWFKTEGEYIIEDDELEEGEVQGLYSYAIGPFFDLQAGVRYDFAPGSTRTFGVVGFQGLAPYLFEIDAAAFISEDGDVSARIEAEYELVLTQRLMLQPRAELNFAVQEVEELGVGSGLSTAEVGVRLRYEIMRELAPYVGVSWQRSVGETADFARAEVESVSSVSFVAGLRIWY